MKNEQFPKLSNRSSALGTENAFVVLAEVTALQRAGRDIISFCIAASVVVCILAIWDFTKKDSLWRLVASFLVVGAGTALFALINGIFGEEENG